jgi:hypothetical protein
MLERRNAWFVQQENAFKLAISRELHRICSKVLEEPVPPNLQRLIQHLEQVTTPVDQLSRTAEQDRGVSARAQ